MLRVSWSIKFLSAQSAFTTFPWLPSPFASHVVGSRVLSIFKTLSGVAWSWFSQLLICLHSGFNLSMYFMKVDVWRSRLGGAGAGTNNGSVGLAWTPVPDNI